MHIHDLIGIGFGPSNVALAIALEEKGAADALFIERQTAFGWHPGMLLGDAHMQISYLKDLATLRDPRSRFTFVNYLHEKGRLPDFINLKTFFPSRLEFHDYLAWAAAHFDECCAYGEDVFEVLPERRGPSVELLRVRSRRADSSVRERLARHVVVGVGGKANVPDAFGALRGDARVFHSSRYLQSMAERPACGRVAVIGAGQSAAEIFLDLHGRGDTRVDLVTRSRAIRPSDDSPFVNEIFNADFTDFVYDRPQPERAALLDEYWHTNYAAPDLALVERIFGVLYAQQIAGTPRHRLLRRHDVASVRADAQGVHLTLVDLDGGAERIERYDAVVLATGYTREHHKDLLAPLAPWLGDFRVDRLYRVESASSFRPAVFLQGACEASHGLGDSLLSVTSVRTGEIAEALLEASRTPPPVAAPSLAVAGR